MKCKASFQPVRLFTFGNIRSSIIRATVGRIRRYRNPIYTRPLPIYTDYDNGAFKQCRTSCSGLLFRPYSFEFFQERFNREIPIPGRRGMNDSPSCSKGRKGMMYTILRFIIGFEKLAHTFETRSLRTEDFYSNISSIVRQLFAIIDSFK